jgi:general secretion pathway protein J
MSTARSPHLRNADEDGFTLVEMLIAIALMGFVLAALVTVTAQWLPNWDRGIARVQLTEQFAYGLNRMVEDLSVAEMVPANNATKVPLFEGSELAVTFVRTTIGPNSQPGLEVVRFREAVDASGPTLIRENARYTPMDAGAQLRFADPVVLVHPPYLVTFAYAGTGGAWRPTWVDAAQLPRSVRITVRDSLTQQLLALSTAALVHIDTPAECVRVKNLSECLEVAAQPAKAGTQGNTEAR